MKSWKQLVLVFVIAFSWFAVFMPWGLVRDPDAFYHAKMSELIARQGFVHAFPWLDLTTLGTSFADQHLLLHIITIPLQRVFGMFYGMQLSALVLASICVSVMYIVLKRLRVPWPSVWTTLFALSPAMMFRLTIGKASPLAISWFLLGVLAVMEGIPWLGFLAGFGFALSHGGWILLLASQMVVLAGVVVSDKAVLQKTVGTALRQLPWRTVGTMWLGVATGIALHPNRESLLNLLWVQVVRIGVVTPFDRVFLGAEWLPSSVKDLIAITALLCMASCVMTFALVKARSNILSCERFGVIIGIGLLLACLFALTFKSNRFIEYLVPTWILFLALLGSMVDWKRAWEFLQTDVKRARALYIILVCSIMASLGQNLYQEYSALRKGASAFYAYDSAVQAIRRITNTGDRVMTTDWDEFPQLFSALDDRRYVSGLDPTFLLEANPKLSDEFRDLTLGRTTSTAYTFIHDELHAKAVFVTVEDHKIFDEALAHDARFERVFDEKDIRVYRVKE